MTASPLAPEHEPAGPVLARVQGLTKSYPGVRALVSLDLEARAGEVLAICGANGAGKSTFARLLAGQEPPDSGSIEIAGHDGPIRTPAAAQRAGILLMHQEPLIIDDFTVGENLWLYTLRSGRDVRPWSRPAPARDARTRDVLRTVGLGTMPPSAPATALGPGQRQILALARAEVTEHQILILDETTASTTEEHFAAVQEMVERERAAGTCVIFVSHRLLEVFALADRIAVLRNGELVSVTRTADTDAGKVTALMVGEALRASEQPRSRRTPGVPPLVSVRGVSGGAAKDVSFDLFAGEVVGLYGLVGSGRSSLARSVTGQRRPLRGVIEVNGKPMRFASPRAALRHGVAYVTEDRRLEGFVPDFDNGQNLTLVVLASQLARGGVVNRRRSARVAEQLISRYRVKGGARTMTSQLSGGNQQKVCIAKWLQADPRFVVLDEPTKGIDVGARASIYALVHEMAERGQAVLIVSSEAEELLTLCHRCLVMRDGRLVAEFGSGATSTGQLIRAALGEVA